jgi:pimeloyl-ACP methyl ester carboxylesterase
MDEEAKMNRRMFLGMAAVGGGLLAGAGAATVQPPTRPRAPDPVAARDGTRLFVRDWGDGAPVLFLAGWTLASDFWGYQMAALQAQGLRCIAYDRRGHGRSSDPGGGYDHDTLADDLAAVIEHRGLAGLTLVGHSMASGEIARYVARHGTGRIARIVLVGPTTPFLMQAPDNPTGLPREAMAASRASIARDFPGQIGAQIGPFFTAETSPDAVAWVKAMMLRTSLQAVIECARALQETDFRRDLPRIDVPALIVHGDADRSAPLAMTGRPTAELIPGARLVVVEGGPHGLPVTHVDRLNAELLGFMRSA